MKHLETTHAFGALPSIRNPKSTIHNRPCWLLFLCLTILVSSCVHAGPTTNALLNKDSTLDAILDDLHERGVGLKSFTADLTITHENSAMGDSDTTDGHVWYQLKGPDNPRVRVTFETKTVNNRKRVDKHDYLLEDGVLWDRNYNLKPPVQIKRQVLKPGQKLNLLKLGEGPFPLPIGQDKAEVQKHFDASKIAADKDDPANTVHIRLIPKPDTSFARKFHQLDIFVDLTGGMPTRIAAMDADQAEVRTTDLKNLQVNTGVKDEDFHLPMIDNTWDQKEETYHD